MKCGEERSTRNVMSDGQLHGNWGDEDDRATRGLQKK